MRGLLVAVLLVGCGGESAPTTDGRWREVAPVRAGSCETLLDVAAGAYTMHVQCWTAPNVSTRREETGALTADWRINDYGLLLAPDGRAFARLP